MLTKLLLLLKPLIQKYIINKVLAWAAWAFERWQRNLEIDKAAEKLKEAGTKPELTPEQKAKEQEDAFDKLHDTVNKPR